MLLCTLFAAAASEETGKDAIWRQGQAIIGASASLVLGFFRAEHSFYARLIWFEIWKEIKGGTVSEIQKIAKLLSRVCCHCGRWNPSEDSLSPKTCSVVGYICLNHADEIHKNRSTDLSLNTGAKTVCLTPQSVFCALRAFIYFAAVWWKYFWNETLLKGDTPPTCQSSALWKSMQRYRFLEINQFCCHKWPWYLCKVKGNTANQVFVPTCWDWLADGF